MARTMPIHTEQKELELDNSICLQVCCHSSSFTTNAMPISLSHGRCTALVEGTIGVKLACGAERVTIAKPEAIESGACGKARRW